ncbi:MAG TPA: hypothetical protein VFU19_05170 [Iamia sp.]|nr:hypothetical protein [Iamia sp.]
MLTERNRAVLHQRLTALVRDEEAVNEMLSHFPNDDRHSPATEAFVDAKVNALDAKVNGLGLRLVMWMVGLQVAGVGVVLGVIKTWLPA